MNIFVTDIAELNAAYQALSSFRKFFFPKKIARELDKINSNNAPLSPEKILAIYNIATQNTWFFHRWAFAALSAFFNSRSYQTYDTLHSIGLLANKSSQVNFNAVLKHKNPFSLTYALSFHQRAGLLTGDTAQANFDALARHQRAYYVNRALILLQTAGLLTGDTAQATFDAVVRNQDPEYVAEALILLQRAGLLTGDAAQANRDALARHQRAYYVNRALILLQTAGLLTGDTAQATFDAVVRNQDPESVAKALILLQTAGLLTGDTAQATFDAVVRNQDPESVAKALILLQTAGLLTGDTAQATFDAVVRNQDPESVAKALILLQTAGLLTGDTAQATFDAVVRNQDPESVAKALILLQTAGLLTGDTAQATFDAVVRNQYPEYVAEALILLQRAGLLTGDAAQANRDAMARHQRAYHVNRALILLQTAGLLTGDTAQANFDAVVRNQYPESVAEALILLQRAGLLTGDAAQANFDALVGNQNPYAVVNALIPLQRAGLLTGDAAQANFDALVGNQNPYAVVNALILLQRAGLLTGDTAQANFDAVVRNQDPEYVAEALILLQRAGLLTGDAAQANLVTHAAVFFGAEDVRNMWCIIPPHLFTQALWTRMIEIADAHRDTHDAGRRTLLEHIYRALNVDQHQARQGIIRVNPAQSTHTSSVHCSVSASAMNLNNQYLSSHPIHEQNATEERALQDMGGWIQAINQRDATEITPHKINAAQRAWKRISAPDFIFTDPTSKISVRTLCALIWMAIHDQESITSSVADAENMLIEALYEVQRGYNLDADGVDNMRPEDMPICTSGTFNKLTEKLHGIHPNVQIRMVTHQLAAQKLPCVVKEHALVYLRGLDKRDAEKLLENDDIATIVWKNIQDNVTKQMFEEYGPDLFDHNKHHPTFIELIESAVYALDNDALKKQLLESIETSNGSKPRSRTVSALHAVGFHANTQAAASDSEPSSLQEALPSIKSIGFVLGV